MSLVKIELIDSMLLFVHYPFIIYSSYFGMFVFVILPFFVTFIFMFAEKNLFDESFFQK